MIYSDKSNRLDVEFGTLTPLQQTHDNCHDIMACEKHVVKEFDVSVPVTISPSVTPQKPEVKCEGEVKVHRGIDKCKNPEKDFKFTAKQNISVRIPIKYRVKTCYGEECFEAVEAA